MCKIGGRTYGDYLIEIDLQKAEFFGDEYIMQYMLSRYRSESKEKVYKAYVTDTLKVIAENKGILISQKKRKMSPKNRKSRQKK